MRKDASRIGPTIMSLTHFAWRVDWWKFGRKLSSHFWEKFEKVFGGTFLTIQSRFNPLIIVQNPDRTYVGTSKFNFQSIYEKISPPGTMRSEETEENRQIGPTMIFQFVGT